MANYLCDLVKSLLLASICQSVKLGKSWTSSMILTLGMGSTWMEIRFGTNDEQCYWWEYVSHLKTLQVEKRTTNLTVRKTFIIKFLEYGYNSPHLHPSNVFSTDATEIFLNVNLIVSTAPNPHPCLQSFNLFCCPWNKIQMYSELSIRPCMIWPSPT